TAAPTTREAPGRARPGGRSARVRAAVLAATLELLAERGYEQMELPEVARRAGVNVTTVYRRWGSKARLAREGRLERASPTLPAPYPLPPRPAVSPPRGRPPPHHPAGAAHLTAPPEPGHAPLPRDRATARPIRSGAYSGGTGDRRPCL